MTQSSLFEYHYGHEADQYTFYRLPKALFTCERYKNLSAEAKILYGLMLDRMGLSVKNGWMDEHNRVYIYFTLDDINTQMNCKNDKGVKMLAELDTVKGVGLIERVKQGQGKPSIIYVRKFIDATETQTTEKPKSALLKNRSLDFGKSECNKNDSNNTYLNDTEIQSVCHGKTDRTDNIADYRDLIMDNVDYDILAERYGQDRMNGVVNLMVETVCSNRPYLSVNGEKFPAEVVRSRLLKLDSSDIEFVFERLDQNTTHVRNIRAYMLTALYNAPTDKDEYYRAAVNHDLYRS